MRWSFIIVALAFATPLQAQDQQPTVSIDLDQTEVVPGQYATLRMTILVPTWMPRPAEFPSLEMPNLRVRLPSESTTPVSQNINGETWAGVSRRYLLTPMVPGDFVIPPQDVLVTYAAPGSTEPVEATVQTPGFTLSGVVPEGAEGLDPFIAARSLTLDQELSGPTTDLAPGEGVTWTVTATIDGASPIVLPPLLPTVTISGVKSYPEAPQVNETDNRGDLSGSRIEKATLMAEGGGSGAVPGIGIDWFNLDSGEIETSTLVGFDISVDGPVLSSDTSRPVPWKLVVAILVGAIAAVLVLWRLVPTIRASMAERHRRKLASKDWAKRQLLAAIKRRDYPKVMHLVEDWATRTPRTTARCMGPISAALAGIGATIYGNRPSALPDDDWIALENAVRDAGNERSKSHAGALPPLNPGHEIT